jgi:hypothetical protein
MKKSDVEFLTCTTLKPLSTRENERVNGVLSISSDENTRRLLLRVGIECF